MLNLVCFPKYFPNIFQWIKSKLWTHSRIGISLIRLNYLFLELKLNAQIYRLFFHHLGIDFIDTFAFWATSKGKQNLNWNSMMAGRHVTISTSAYANQPCQKLKGTRTRSVIIWPYFTHVLEVEIVCFNRDFWVLTASSKLPVLFRRKIAMFSVDLVTLSWPWNPSLIGRKVVCKWKKQGKKW